RCAPCGAIARVLGRRRPGRPPRRTHPRATAEPNATPPCPRWNSPAHRKTVGRSTLVAAAAEPGRPAAEELQLSEAVWSSRTTADRIRYADARSAANHRRRTAPDGCP